MVLLEAMINCSADRLLSRSASDLSEPWYESERRCEKRDYSPIPRLRFSYMQCLE
jgi:hypothetical protein